MKALARKLLLCAAAGIVALTPRADAQEYPAKPIHIIVGFAAGGGNDIIARVFGQRLSERLGQPVIVENKPGAGTNIANEFVDALPIRQFVRAGGAWRERGSRIVLERIEELTPLLADGVWALPPARVQIFDEACVDAEIVVADDDAGEFGFLGGNLSELVQP